MTEHETQIFDGLRAEIARSAARARGFRRKSAELVREARRVEAGQGPHRGVEAAKMRRYANKLRGLAAKLAPEQRERMSRLTLLALAAHIQRQVSRVMLPDIRKLSSTVSE
jgi:hypothetical protein